MASSKWKTKEEILLAVKEKQVLFWGSSHWAERTSNLLGIIPIAVIDSNLTLQGKEIWSSTIISPNDLSSFNNCFIVITSGSYQSIITILEHQGFVMGENFCCSPLLNDKKDLDYVKETQVDLLISCPDPDYISDGPGGLYEYRDQTSSLIKKYSGKARAFCTLSDHSILLIDMMKGVVRLSSNYEIINCINLLNGHESHGLCVDDEEQILYVSHPGRDSIGVYEIESGNNIDEIRISNKWIINKKDNHHVNDLFFKEGSLFVSMFSLSGNWRNNVYDGGILEISLDDRASNPILRDLWMPHSIFIRDTSTYYADSMLGNVCTAESGIVATFNGFIRGIDFHDDLLFAGSTQHRYPEKLKPFKNTISADTGVYIYHFKSKISRFIPLNQLTGIHSLAFIDIN